MYMRVKDGIPLGWREDFKEGYIEVDSSMYTMASENPLWTWDGKTFCDPRIPEEIL